MSATHSVLIYGQTKVGKTSDVAYGFYNKQSGACHALFVVTEAGALDPVKHNWGFTPDHFEFYGGTGTEMIDLAGGPVLDALQTKKYAAVVFDSLTAFCERVLSAHSKEKYGHDPRKLYPKISDEVLTAVDVWLRLPTAVFFLCHEQSLKTSPEGRFLYRGGPRLPGRLVEIIPGRVRTILRAHVEDGKRVYTCDPMSPKWIMADSYACAKQEQDLDIRPMLYRMFGKQVPESLEPKVYKEVV